ncbi:MAG TPA: MaoC family dehydratase, partial [Blastocatellia bacterium]|nr:MaoC family dehydratase [Blastocatellia bacterium]
RTDSPFGNTIAHGFLTLSLISHLAKMALEVRGNFKMGINYGLNRVRFPSPVPSGSRIRAHFTLQSVEDVTGGAQITWSVTTELEGAAKPCMAAEWLVRYYS